MSHSRTNSTIQANNNIYDEVKYKHVLNEYEKLKLEKKHYDVQKVKLNLKFR